MSDDSFFSEEHCWLVGRAQRAGPRTKVGVAIEGRASGLVVEGGLQTHPSPVGRKGDGGGQGVA